MQIGVIGIGLMGWPMALRLQAGGHEVHVCDLDARRIELAQAAGGFVVEPSAAALASACERVIVVVVDAGQVEQVLLGPGGVVHARPLPQSLMLCPTIAAADTERFAAALEAVGVMTIDAPMSGGPPRVRDGSLSLMVACSDAAFTRWQPLLAQMASALHRVSTRPGDGARTKLVNNLLAAVHLAGISEAMVLAERIGLDLPTTLAVIESSSGQSWIGSERMQRALAGDTTPSANMALLAKDSALALSEARGAGLATPVGDAAAALFAAALAAGLALADDSSLWRFVARR